MRIHHCRHCQTELKSPENWRPYLYETGNLICTPCRRAEEKRHYENPERRQKAQAMVRRWQNANPNYTRDYYIANRERILAERRAKRAALKSAKILETSQAA